jgi:UDP-glucose 4-epimerase
LASPNEQQAESDPEAAVEGTIGVTVRLLEESISAGVSRLVYVSTIQVYGAPLIGRVDESHPTRPVHPYAITHRAAEDFVLAARRRGIESAVIRLSNAVGAPINRSVNRWSLVANDVSRQLMESGQFALRSSGRQYRDFVPMADACRAIEHLLFLPTQLLADGVFNVGAGRSMRVRDLVLLVCQRYERLTGNVPEVHIPPASANEDSQPLDYRIDKLLNTGFRLTASLEDELDATLRLCAQSAAYQSTDPLTRSP